MVFICRADAVKTSTLRLIVSKRNEIKKGMCFAGDNPARRCRQRKRRLFGREGKRTLYRGRKVRARGPCVDGVCAWACRLDGKGKMKERFV